MLKYTTFSDVGCIRIFTKDVSFYFRNKMGDGKNRVIIYGSDEPDLTGPWFAFSGSFEVYAENMVFLSEYDCNNKSCYAFIPGRYFVYLDTNTYPIPEFHIQWLPLPVE